VRPRESYKRNDRPALATALKRCRKHRATLVIAKLDHLARNVAFISKFMESGVDFVAVDMPQANVVTRSTPLLSVTGVATELAEESLAGRSRSRAVQLE
jgi:DNA invertase Pin-like site-specific DNA recombinase